MNATLVTGASGGIGLELTKLLAKDGHNLVLVARSEERLKKLATELTEKYGIEVMVVAIDLSQSDATDKVYKITESKGITVDVLVNNAGFGDYGLFVDADLDKTLRMIALNITTLTGLTRLFLSQMKQRKFGKILNVASTAAFQPGPLMAVYFATKNYVLAFSEAIANEMKEFGVSVTALCPGATATGFMKAANMSDSKLFKEKKIPDSKQVALFGYRAMLKGKRVAIHGIGNKLLAFSVRITPRKLVTTVTRKVMSK